MSCRGILSSFLTDKFEALGKQGFQVIQHAVEDPESLKQGVIQEVDDLRQRYQLKNTLTLQEYNIGTSKALWDCRIATLPLWQRLFRTKYLISSWDGMSFVPPQMQREMRVNVYGEPDWLHRDQRLSNANLADTVQGFLCLSDNEPEAYSTVFYAPQKHSTAQEMVDEMHATFYTRQNRYGRIVKGDYSDEDYHLFKTEELEWLRANCQLVKPWLKKGDLLLWCSAIPHAAAPSLNCESLSSTRMGTYVSMFPKDFVNKLHLLERKHIFKTKLTSSHNVLYPRLFPFSHTGEIEKKNRSKMVLTKEMRELIG